MEVVWIVLAVVAYLAYQHWKQKQRREYLMEKYGDERVVRLIMERGIWQGQTAEMLRDSLGSPVAVDRGVMKTTTRDVWKYHPSGKNRYDLRVTVENGEVVGWEKKG